MARAKTRGPAANMNPYGSKPSYSAGMPKDKDRKMELQRALCWLNYEGDLKKVKPQADAIAKKHLSPANYKNYRLGDITFTEGKLMYLISVGWQPNDHESGIINAALQRAVKQGKAIAKEKAKEEKAKKAMAAPVISPAERLKMKVNDTILSDLDEHEDKWIDGEEVEFDLFTAMQGHELKGAVPSSMVAKWIEPRLSELREAVLRKDPDMKEAYGHITLKRLRARIKTLEKFLDEAQKFALSAKATRTPRAKKAPAAVKQVAKVKYLKQSNDYQVTSIDPINIVGAHRLYVFNAKTREITEYVTFRTQGFEIKGSTLQHFDADVSRKTKLRKPEDFLKLALTKTPKQIDNAFKKLVTKINVPNGRFNDDTVILRVLDK